MIWSAVVAVAAVLVGYWVGGASSSPELETKTATDAKAEADATAAPDGAQHEAKTTTRVAKAKEPKQQAPIYTCNICNHTGKFQRFARRDGAVCPTCKSKERHRLLMHWIVNESSLATQKLDVLHFSPEDAEKDFLRELTNLHYVTADYLHEEELRLDLTALELPDASWDVLIIYHVLEHIVEDRKAMAEMFRVLRPGGMAILQVPIEIGREEIYEDASIVDPKARTRAFGQSDHVRRYSASGFQARLEQAGFEVEAIDYIATLGPEVVARHRMAGAWRVPLDERIWLAKKPLQAGKGTSTSVEDEDESGREASAREASADSRE